MKWHHAFVFSEDEYGVTRVDVYEVFHDPSARTLDPVHTFHASSKDDFLWFLNTMAADATRGDGERWFTSLSDLDSKYNIKGD